MSNLKYISARAIRHFLPEGAVSFLLKHSLIIRPGLETLTPEKAVKRYVEKLNQHKIVLTGKRVLIFGYGGNLTIGCLLLEAGARQVVLCEREGFPFDLHYEELGKRFPQYFIREADRFTLNPQSIILYHGDIAKLAADKSAEKNDLVLSTSVFEHLTKPDIVTNALARLTSASGSHLHFIDLRDHYFKYPFEMLCYRKSTWERWLNPTSNLNRFRISDYRTMFNRCFSETKIVADERDMQNFLIARARIQKQFVSGDDEEDSTTQIHLLASNPKINTSN